MNWIFLDTNYLIALAAGERAVLDQAMEWEKAGRPLATSSPAWSEFLSGPLHPADRLAVEALLENRIVPFGPEEADCAARLYWATNSKRADRLDTFIAATAIIAGAHLATRNRRDFLPFIPYGLKLA